MQINVDEIARILGRGKESKLGDGGWKTRCPAHDDKASSLTIRDVRGKILVRCHAGCTQEQVITCLQEMDLWPKKERRASWDPIHPVPDNVKDPGKDRSHSRLGKPVRRWTYLDGDGKLLGYIYRFEDQTGKTLLPLSYCKSDDDRYDWQWKSFEKPRPLYGLDRLKQKPNAKVAIFEGEKAADAAQLLFPDYVCMSWPGGSKAVKYVDLKPLYQRDVTLWPDADKPGYDAMQLLAEILLTDNSQRVKLVDIPANLPKGWDVADEKPGNIPLDLPKMLANAINFEPVGDKVIDQFNKRYALVLVGGKATIIRETPDHFTGKTELTYISPEAFNQFYCNQRVPVGRAEVPAGKYWITHEDRRSYEGITFAPGRDVPSYYNLWRGFSYDSDPTGDYSIFREHLLDNAANGNQEHFNWIFGWFAQMIQKPWKKVGTSLSFRGKQGTGKTIIGKVMGSLISQHYTLVDNSRLLFHNFNSHMASTILLHSDEGFWGGDPKHVGQLRSLVTSDTHYVEYKGRDPIAVDNYMRLLITTNQDWVIPAASEERRFAVFDMGDGREQDRSYFVEMLRQLRDGGYGGLLHDLLNFDLSKVDIGLIPNTQALQDQKETSMSDVAKFWFTCLMDAEILPGYTSGFPSEISATRFYEVFCENLNKWGTRYKPTQNEFIKELQRLAPEGTLDLSRRSSNGKKFWVCTLPNLDQAREFFDEQNNSQFKWRPADPVEVQVKHHKKEPPIIVDEIPF